MNHSAIASLFSEEWRSYVEPLGHVGGRLVELLADPQDPQSRQEMYVHLYSVIAQGYFGLFYAEAAHPSFWPILNSAFNTLAPNPDDSYYLAPIEGDGVYRISGFRGTVHILSFSIGSGSLFTQGTGSHGPVLADYKADDLQIGQDGSFEVVLSQTRPEGCMGDWWPLDPKASTIMVRQRSYDWLNEVEGRLAIERLDRPAVKPRPSAAELAAKLREIAGWAERNTKRSIEIFNGYREKGLINQVFLHGYPGGVPTQKYVDGLFDLKPDEALILETEVPMKCLYWNFQLTDELYATIDYVNRQTSLNGHSARLDADGKFRAVISARDPGVPNWLDTAGYRRGGILGRWQEYSNAPLPTLTKVNVAEVRRHLPADTHIVTEEAREASLRSRSKAYQMRCKW